MKDLALLETCIQYTTTRNRYGDLILTSLGTIPCLFRNISTLSRGFANRESVSIDGIMWFAPTATVAQGDVVDFGGTKYRIERVNDARARLTDNARHVIKCQVSKARQIS